MHSKRIFYLLLALILGFGLFLTLAATYSQTIGMVTPPQTYPRTAQVQAHQFDASGLNFTLSTPQLTLTDQGAVQIPGLDSQTQEPGAPLLPIYVTLIALPPEAQLSVAVETKNIASSNVDSVVSVPRPPNSNGEIGRVASSSAVSISPDSAYATLPTLVNAPDPNIYEKNNFFPELIYEVSDPYYYRDLRLVELRLYPVRYNPVTKNLLQAQTLSVSIRFSGSQLEDLHPVQTTNDTPIQALADQIINYDQAKAWRSLPADLINSAASNFPSEIAETYKIEVDQDGIYELSGSELAAAGMNISAVDPATIEMMVRGQSVAYQFDGDGDTVFEADEIIRFYGWAFDGPRTEKQFINNNVFWLWAGGVKTPILTTTNQTGFPVVTSTISTITKEPETLFSTTYTDNWENFPNEPDSWYWDLTKQADLGAVPTKTYQIDLPYPTEIDGTETATLTVELLSLGKSTQPLDYVYTVTTYLNDYPTFGQGTWMFEQDVNITNTVPATTLAPNNNDVHLVFSSSNANAEIYLNRISVEYLRELAATDNQLIFSDKTSGQRRFQISGFTENDPDKILLWNISDPENPIQFQIFAGDISGSGPFTYSIGSNHPANAKFIATTMTNTLTVAGLSQYLPVDLEPAGGGADWIAISHADFMIPANDLAAHRAVFSNMTTHVVDIEDVTNQYGYGLPLPSAIRDFLADSLATWTPAPGYVTIFGAATYNPRNLDCQHSSCPGSAWDKDQATFVVTDLVYKDRFQGLIPSDQPLVLLTGDDLTADMAIGRIPAETAGEAAATVAKIIFYEQSQANSEPWQQNMLFIADNTDVGGNFFAENESTIALLPDYLNIEHYYLVGGGTPLELQEETDALRDAMYLDINGPGVAILNYRGHGSAAWWASPNILSSDNTNFWQNGANPTVILSADCLDGNFAFPGITALSRTFLTLHSGSTPVGSAAHWSSTGLGYTSEHSALHRSFYNGLYQQNLTSIGDAVNYAKQIYDLAGFHESEIYSFLLQGDPAMQLFSIRYNVYLPAIVR